LNHPNIATLYGLEHLEGHHVLVMELVEGEDLERLLKRGALPNADVIAIGLQVAEALEAAHQAGVVHRDLKPANVMVRPDGTVKVLDFGLAKAGAAAETAAGLSMSPTLTSHGTVAGLVLGTAGYMAPEQAAGKAVDSRADIWAFGVLLWEMLTARRLFAGGSATEVLAAVLRDPIDLGRLPDATPSHVTSLIGRCLDREPRQRLQAIGEARIALGSDWADEATPTETSAYLGRPWAAWAVAAVAVIAAFLAWFVRSPTAPSAVAVTAAVSPPVNADFDFDGHFSGSLSVSPDGRWITFSATGEGGATQLWVRRSDETEARPLPGTENAAFPFWSPYSREVGFFADQTLQRIPLEGSVPAVICPAPDGRGGSWSRDGTIVFAPAPASGIHHVDARGGKPNVLTALDTTGGEATHRWPIFLPDGRHFVFFTGGRGTASFSGVNSLWVADLEGGERRMLTPAASKGVFANGHLLFGENGALVARPFDTTAREFTGASKIVVPDLGGSHVYAVTDFGVSEHEVLIYRTGDDERVLQLRWTSYDDLEPGEPVGEPVAVEELAISPDGTKLGMIVSDLHTDSVDIWIHDFERDARSRLTFLSAPRISEIAWSSDSRRVAYGVVHGDGTCELQICEIDSPGRATTVGERLDRVVYPMDWSLDDARLFYIVDGALHRLDLESGESFEVVGSEAEMFTAELSPDGRWLIYLSGGFGAMIPFVTDMPHAKRRWQVSDRSTIAAHWSVDRGLWMVSPGSRIWEASFAVVDETPVIGRMSLIGELPTSRNGSIHPDGNRGVVAYTVDGGGDRGSPVRVLAGWTARLEKP